MVTTRELPATPGRRAPVTIAGVVTQVRARHEGATFDSDVFAIADGTLPAQVQEAAEVTTTRVEPEIYVPPRPGALVRRAAGRGARRRRSTSTGWSAGSPIGFGRDGEPLYLNADFLDGTRGAHVSISGISGVATKTSFATWLLYSVFRSGVLGGAGETANTRALIFNVKGEDLLFLDHPNTRLDARHALGVRPARAATPARSRRRVYAPPRAGDLDRRARRGEPADRRRRVLLDARRVLRATGCCPSCSPTPTTTASSTRWWSTRSRRYLAARRRAGRRRRRRSTASGSARYPDLVDLHRRAALRRRHPRPTGPAPPSAWARSTRSCAG